MDAMAMTSSEKPPIEVTTWDYRRLSGVVEAFQLRGSPLADFLAEELDRSELVEPSAVSPSVVTMHSCVTFVDHDSDQVRTMTLVYPGEEDSRQNKLSIVTPVGSALLGLRTGASMTFRTQNGRTKRLSVIEVRNQPEVVGLDGAGAGDERKTRLIKALETAVK
jgi:regulator of nucleoside diphosphate kinase